MDDLVNLTRNALSSRVKKSINNPTMVSASVLLLIYPKSDITHMLLNRRSALVTDHKREISLPGGRKESIDRNSWDTALREANEEMGIEPNDVEILGELDDTVTNTNYLISPVVGTIRESYPFKPNPKEVQNIIEIPLIELSKPASLRYDSKIEAGEIVTKPAYAYKGNLVYGATANILYQLLTLIHNSSKKDIL